jgi:protein-S-isoprenylcysteine O-methyltransferase Ste14
MNRRTAYKMIIGYIIGGLLVFGFMPAMIYALTSLLDNVFKLEIINNLTIRWTIIIVLLVIGLIYGIWSIIIQNTIGKGGPVEIGNIEISPKTKNLVVSGPYKTTRNPMLFGTFLVYLAFALFINSLTSIIIVIALFVFMLTVIVKMEEKRLSKDFGNQYEEYRHKVPKFFPWFQNK